MNVLSKIAQRFDRPGGRIIDTLRSVKTMGWVAPLRFAIERRDAVYQAVFDKAEPLVSICIPTYNCADLLIERAVASCLVQTYSNIEILVVGDGCTDNTVERMAGITDPRVKFQNLAERGKYPDDPELRWFVAGCVPFNRLLEIARGDFVTHLDHDDEYTPDRIEKLVAFAQRQRADFIYHPFAWENAKGEWEINDARRFAIGLITTSSSFYHARLKAVKGDLHSYRHREPGDWNRFRRMRFLGACIMRHPDVMLKHYRERSYTQQLADKANAFPTVSGVGNVA